MTIDATPDEPGGGPDDPDFTDPLTPEDILAKANKPESGDSQASRLVTRANGHYRLLRGEDSRPYATERNGPAIVYALRGREALRKRLAGLFFDTYGTTPGGTALTDALCVLEGLADRTEPEPVGLRLAPAGETTVVLDLGGEDGRCVVLDLGGWQLCDRSPVLFRRSALTAPLPEPIAGGNLDELRGLLNVDEERFRLVVAWLVAALVPDIPHPILALTGEQGTAKSTAALLVVSLIDPSPAPLRTAPHEMRSWAAAASASWIVALDNVSLIQPWFSDTLCKAVTGDGIVERALFTDDDISVISFRRCLALTAIDAGRLAGDLAERLLVVELARIPTRRRRPDADITAAYTAARPHILGALLDLTTQVLAGLPGVQVGELPRMADFARLLAALDQARGWDTLASYRTAAAEATQAVLESDPVAEAVIALVGRGGRLARHRQRAARPHHPRTPAPGLAPDTSGSQRRPRPPRPSAGSPGRHFRAPHPRLRPGHHAPRGRPGTVKGADTTVATVATVARPAMTSPNTRDGRRPNRRATVARPSRPTDPSDQGTRRRRDGRDGRVRTFDSDPRSQRRTTQRDRTGGRLLTVAQAADRLGTTERFPRRLIAERRITFVKLGTHVRIPEAALDDLIAASTVQAAE
jgi:excisionase family DNA binding protein